LEACSTTRGLPWTSASRRPSWKVGKSSTTSILFLFAWGDASVAAAARDGGITTIRHADYEYLNVIGLYTSFTTVVRGD
jgi:hypothetical protein